MTIAQDFGTSDVFHDAAQQRFELRSAKRSVCSITAASPQTGYLPHASARNRSNAAALLRA